MFPLWKNIMKVKYIYLEGRKVILKYGHLTRVWQDPWRNNTPLCDQFPQLLDICQKQSFTIAVLVKCNFQIPFCRRLVDDLFVQWDNIVTDIKQVCFNTHSYRIRWSLEKKGIFTTKFVYRWLERNLVWASNKWIWKAVIPLKIKISMWQLFRDSILTRYNLKKWVILFFFCAIMLKMSIIFSSGVIWLKQFGGHLERVLRLLVVLDRYGKVLHGTWLFAFLPGGCKFYVICIAVVCWGIGLKQIRLLWTNMWLGLLQVSSLP